MKIMVINGPNINFIGQREPGIYGEKNYKYLEEIIQEKANNMGLTVSILQNNIEGEIVNYIQKAFFEKYDGIIINPGAYTHTSVAILDAILSVNIPTIEVHISNVYKREEFRHHSYISKGSVGQIAGMGLYGYILAMDGIANHIKEG